LLDQFSTRFIFRVGDPKTANITSNLLGEVETLETQQSVSFGANTMRDGVNLNTLDKRRNLILPTEIMNLSNLTCFVKLAGNWPITKLTMQHNKTEIKNSLFAKRSEVENQQQNLQDERQGHHQNEHSEVQDPKDAAA
jgi:type IV secretory pathway TraG/TraD family ATPase VirD4